MHTSNRHIRCQLKTAPSESQEMDLCWNKKQKTRALTSLNVFSSARGQLRVKRGSKGFSDCKCMPVISDAAVWNSFLCAALQIQVIHKDV